MHERSHLKFIEISIPKPNKIFAVSTELIVSKKSKIKKDELYKIYYL
jgi:hypothetical protein